MKIIHQIWFQGQDNIPEKYKPYIDSVKRNNTDFEYILWDDTSLQQLAKMYSDECYITYMNYTFMHQKIDLGRYLALYFYGGISIDMDMYCTLHLSDVYDSIDKKYELAVSKLPITSLFQHAYNGFKDSINNAVILSFRKRSMILADLIDNIFKQTCVQDESSFSCIQKTTGPYFFTTIINKYNNVYVFESGIIETPCFDKIEICVDDKKTLYHAYEHSWMPVYVSKFFKYYSTYNQFYLFDIIALCIIAFLIYLCIRKNKI